MTPFFAIEIIGSRYHIKHVLPGRTAFPTNGKGYESERAARDAAEAFGLEIAAVGIYPEIITATPTEKLHRRR